MKVLNEVGNKHGRLTVISRASNKHGGHAQWLCKCECGTETVVEGVLLRNGNTKSCGCYKIDMSRLPSGEASFNQMYNDYAQNSKRRGIEWKLSKEYSKLIMEQDCVYCGQSPSMFKLWKVKGQKSYNGPWIHNGIDRIDNNLGYTEDNVVPCCKVCNYAKRDMSKKDFIHWIWQAYNCVRPGMCANS